MKTNNVMALVLNIPPDQLSQLDDDEILRRWQQSGLRTQMIATASEAISRGMPVKVAAQAAGIHPDDLDGFDSDEFSEAVAELDGMDPMNRIVNRLVDEYKGQGVAFDDIDQKQLVARAEIVYAHEQELNSCKCKSCNGEAVAND